MQKITETLLRGLKDIIARVLWPHLGDYCSVELYTSYYNQFSKIYVIKVYKNRRYVATYTFGCGNKFVRLKNKMWLDDNIIWDNAFNMIGRESILRNMCLVKNNNVLNNMSFLYYCMGTRLPPILLHIVKKFMNDVFGEFLICTDNGYIMSELMMINCTSGAAITHDNQLEFTHNKYKCRMLCDNNCIFNNVCQIQKTSYPAGIIFNNVHEYLSEVFIWPH